MDNNQIHSVHTYQHQSGLISEDDMRDVLHYRDLAQLAEYGILLRNGSSFTVTHINGDVVDVSIILDKQPVRSDYD